MGNNLTVEIYGTNYSITSAEEPEYVRSLAHDVNEMVTDLIQQNGLSLNQALLLICLHYLDSLKKSEQSADHMREQVSEYLKDANSARLALTAIQKEIDRIERQSKPQTSTD